MRIVALLLGVVVVLTLLGCGGGEHASRSASTTSATRAAPPAAETTPGERPPAGGPLLQLADLPADWRNVPTPGPDLKCAGDPFRDAASVKATDRLIQESWGIQEVVALFKTDAATRKAFAQLNSPQGLACLRRNARRRMVEEAGGPASRLQLARVEPLGSWGKAIRYTGTVERGYGPMKGFIDAVHAHVGRRVAALVVVAGLKPIDEAVYQDVVARISERLRGGLG